MQNHGWVVVVFEHADRAQFPDEVAYVKGPFEYYRHAEDWISTAKHCADGKCQITFIEHPAEELRRKSP